MDTNKQGGREPRTFWYTLARVLLFLFMPLFFPVRYHNKQRVNDMDAPYMLVGNHVSLLDPVIIPLPIKRYEVRFLGKKELVKNPILGYIIKRMHMIAVSRHMTDMAAMRACNEVLRNGHVLGIFPEGTRKPVDTLMEGVESGISLIALRNQVPVMPVYTHGRPRMFRLTHVYYLPPLDYDHLKSQGFGKDVCDQLTDIMVQAFQEARKQALADGKPLH